MYETGFVDSNKIPLTERDMTYDEFVYMQNLHVQIKRCAYYRGVLEKGNYANTEFRDCGVVINGKLFYIDVRGLDRRYTFYRFANTIEYPYDFVKSISLISCYSNENDTSRELILIPVQEWFNISSFQKRGIPDKIQVSIRNLGIQDEDYFYVTKFYIKGITLFREIYSSNNGSAYYSMGGEVPLKDLVNNTVEELDIVIQGYEEDKVYIKELYIIGCCKEGKYLIREEQDGESIVIVY